MGMEKYFKFISTTIAILLLFSSSIDARHIIGGEIYYETISPGEYEFTLIVYRDCASGGALFDSQNTPFGSATPGTVSVYRSDIVLPYDRVVLAPPDVESIEIDPDNPCLIAPSFLCVERGEYKFRLELPISDHTYTIAYQRCCRNNTINNIENPGASGATYAIDISPFAQQIGNNSIQFSNFPPVVICNQESLNFDHSAFDPDEQSGNRIEYSFCAPFLGGGLAGSNGNPGLATDLNGVAPDPDQPPPYNEVIFAGGDFTSSTPMGGNPVIEIDPESGFITGTPTDLGQFVVGVCATEFDSTGSILSQIRRDFQFNVVECDAAVTASMIADSLDDAGNFVINACGRSQVQFTDSSFLREFVSTHEWTFEVNNGPDIISNVANPLIDFPDLGTYPGYLIINKNSVCSDTAEFLVNILGAIENDFTFDYDTCRAGIVTFEGSSSTENNQIVERNWQIDGVSTAQGQVTTFEFLTPGEKSISYEVIDDEGCVAITERFIPYFPIPNQIDIEATTNGECEPVTVQFNNLSYPLDERYDIYWDFGDGNSSTQISPSHIYDDPGVYEVFLSITSPIGCEYEGIVEQAIPVKESPVADFSYSPQSFDQINNTARFTDLSQDAENWNWTFDSFSSSDDQNPVFSFPDTGIMEVQLLVTHINGCTDTSLQYLDIIPNPVYFLPNAFRPFGENNTYRGTGKLAWISRFEMNIFDRWGGKVFTTTDPLIGWNGRRDNTGNMLPAGVYVCQVQFYGPRGNRYTLREFATLIQ